jgi:hypothetical protein
MSRSDAALLAMATCLGSVLVLMGVNFWLTTAIAGGLGVVWGIAGFVVEEIQGRRMLRRDSRP